MGILGVLGFSVLLGAVHAQDRPTLFFREDWTETPAALPVTQAHVSNPDLVLALHGRGGARIKKSHHDQPADDPYYIWSGEADAPWAVTLRHRQAAVDSPRAGNDPVASAADGLPPPARGAASGG